MVPLSRFYGFTPSEIRQMKRYEIEEYMQALIDSLPEED